MKEKIKSTLLVFIFLFLTFQVISVDMLSGKANNNYRSLGISYIVQDERFSLIYELFVPPEMTI